MKRNREEILEWIEDWLKRKEFADTRQGTTLKISETTSFSEDLGMDSLDVLELRMDAEKELKCKLRIQDDYETIGDVLKQFETNSN